MALRSLFWVMLPGYANGLRELLFAASECLFVTSADFEVSIMADFDFEERDDTPRPRRREVGHGRSAFGTMFGGSMGCVFAVVAVALVAFALVAFVCAGCVGVGMLARPEPTPKTEPAPKVDPVPKR